MGKSRRKHPGHGVTCAQSNKEFKKQEHRRERRAAKVALKQGKELPHPKEFNNEWNSPRDGKTYWLKWDAIKKGCLDIWKRIMRK